MNKNNNYSTTLLLLTETNFLLDIIFEQSVECDRRKSDHSCTYFIATNPTPDTSAIFLTRDQADFDSPYLRQELAELGVELVFSAGECIRRIREILFDKA